MKRTIPCLLVVCLLSAGGCGPRNGQEASGPTSQLTSPAVATLGPPAVVPDAVVAAIPKRMGTLKTGMSESQVMDALGLTPYRDLVVGNGGGSIKNHWTKCQLRPDGCIIVLSFDCTAGWDKGKFLSAHLSGIGWPTNNTKIGEPTGARDGVPAAHDP